MPHWVFIYKRPANLLSDKATCYTSRFFTAVCTLLGVKNCFTTAYHPQADGQVERYSWTLVSTLQLYIANNQQGWDHYMDALIYGYNFSAHRAIGMKPFDLLPSRVPDILAIQQVPSLSSTSGPTEFKKQYLNWLRNML